MATKRFSDLVLQLSLFGVCVTTSMILTACRDSLQPESTASRNPLSINPMSIDDLNYDVRDPDPESGGLFSGAKGYFELLDNPTNDQN